MTAMSPPKSPPASRQSVAPSTPRSSAGNLPPRTPGSSRTVSNCTADTEEYQLVTIHTAKCTECDLRNKATMRRCPGCTFQLCQICHDKRKAQGKSFVHGAMASGLQDATPAKRIRPWEMKSTPPAPPCAAVTPPSHDSKNGAIKSVAKRELSADDHVDASSPLSHAAKKPRVDRLTPKTEATTPVPQGNPNHGRDSMVSSPPETPRSSPFGSGRPVLPSFGREFGYVDARSSIDPALDDLATRSSAARNLSDMSTQELMEYHGVDTPGNRYKEHPLSRRFPVVQNPSIRMPPQFSPGYTRRSGEEQMDSIRQKVRQKLAAKASLKAAPSSEPISPQKTTKAIRHIVEEEVFQLVQGCSVHGDQKIALRVNLENAARKWANRFHRELGPGLRSQVARGLDMQVDMLSEKQLEDLAAVLRFEATRLLNDSDFEDEEVAQRSDKTTTPSLTGGV